MEVWAYLWSYDNRWMFEYKFTKTAWIISAIFQGLIAFTTSLIGFFSPVLEYWMAFRLMVSLSSICISFALTLSGGTKQQRSYQWILELFLVVLGISNSILTLKLGNNTDGRKVVEICSDLQIFMYLTALIPLIVIFIGFFVVKFVYLGFVIFSPEYLVKVRS